MHCPILALKTSWTTTWWTAKIDKDWLLSNKGQEQQFHICQRIGTYIVTKSKTFQTQHFPKHFSLHLSEMHIGIWVNPKRKICASINKSYYGRFLLSLATVIFAFYIFDFFFLVWVLANNQLKYDDFKKYWTKINSDKIRQQTSTYVTWPCWVS